LAKIPFHIISGFLGSGKTTFLKRIIETYSEKIRIGIIQNEFAPANIDGAELKQTGYSFQLLEVNNGSVFCMCLLHNFSRSLERFIDENKPEAIIMEASGLSDTTSVFEILSLGSISGKVFLASNWCIVDALNFGKSGLMKQRILHQLRMADVVVVNKTDLAVDDIENIRDEIRSVNPFAEIRETAFCKVDFEIGQTPPAKFYFGQEQSMPRPGVNAMVIKSTRKLSLESLENFLKKWAPLAYRIKGFINLDTGETAAVQCTLGTIGIKIGAPAFCPTELVALSDQFTLREWNKSFREF